MIRSRSIKKGSKKRITLFMFVIFFVTLGAHLAIKVETIKLGYRKTKAIIRKERLEEENKQLKREVSKLRSPDRLRKKGKELGLCPPRPDQIVFTEE